jgi:hypothetical protein
MDQTLKIKEIAAHLAASFVKNYKYPLQDATDYFYEKLSANPDIVTLITNAASAKQLSKSATFKEFVKKQKKDLYYKLRKYKNNDDTRAELLQSLTDAASAGELLEKLARVHISSGERFEEQATFYNELSQTIASATTIVDVGCGVQPLFFPKHQFPGVTKYIALDKDRESVEIMQRFKQAFPSQYEWLYPLTWNISEGWEQVRKTFGMDAFDAALVLKLVPVVKRIDPSLLDELAKIPASTIIISGVKESMVKKHDIEHKERRAIMNFIKNSGREVTGEFELSNEFFLIVS